MSAKKSKGYHNPDGDPCKKCNRRAKYHRVDHHPAGDPCDVCGLPDRNHRKRTTKERLSYIGLDGEGQGRTNHRYVLLAASDETGSRKWFVESEEGKRLTTKQCLDMILSLPTKRTKIFTYSFNYDITKILTDVDNESIYKLFRPNIRRRAQDEEAKGPMPVEWQGYYLNLQGTKFTVTKGDKRVVVWDLFKFFQAKFVEALKLWKVGSKELHDRMELMKNKRSEFDKETRDAVRDYCFEECACIASLARKLIEAHEASDLQLRTYYGAGSSGAAMLTAMGIKDQIRPTPPAMRHAVSSAFFGGRFENSVIGEIRGEVHDYDISSAYPYQLYFLPCLLHGRWTRTTNRYDLVNTKTAVVRYSLDGIPRNKDWGPFPFRTADGTISFPIASGGGWVWKDEFLSGERLWPHVRFHEAWTYQTECDCHPFRKISEYYIRRLILGKEGPGIVLKLGCNSCYGKLAQSIGSALFNSWIWAGMITSGCRAQILDFIGLHEYRNNVLTIATDGIKTLEKITPPLPRDTGTWGWSNERGETKPLGGWEHNVNPRGLFVARPGIYFPLEPTVKELKEIKGRGVGKSVVLENWKLILDAWKKDGVNGVATVANVSRFCGAKTCISYTPSMDDFKRAYSYAGGVTYGQWINRKVELSFDPMPKRDSVNPDGRTLVLRKFAPWVTSIPYSRAVHMQSQDSIEMQRATQELLEQPDVDLAEYDLEEAC